MNLTRRRPHHHGSHFRESGGVRIIILVIIAFVFGLVAGAFWLHRSGKEAGPESAVQLSSGTRSILAHLSQPVELRFYALLDPNAAPALREFSVRVERLLATYQQQGNGKIQVQVFDSPTNATPDVALADGIKGFDLDKGEGCYLGVAASSGGKKEVLSQLAPEWEGALEADLSRAISRVSEGSGRRNPDLPVARPDIVETVKQQIPNYTNVSLEEGTRMLREAGLKDFSAMVIEMQAQVQRAQSQLQEAQKSGSPAEQDAAMKRLQEIQNSQSHKLSEIGSKSRAQIDAWKQLKSGG